MVKIQKNWYPLPTLDFALSVKHEQASKGNELSFRKNIRENSGFLKCSLNVKEVTKTQIKEQGWLRLKRAIKTDCN